MRPTILLWLMGCLPLAAGTITVRDNGSLARWNLRISGQRHHDLNRGNATAPATFRAEGNRRFVADADGNPQPVQP
jgi:hypothetical protein